jgi:hypothetical protein
MRAAQGMWRRRTCQYSVGDRRELENVALPGLRARDNAGGQFKDRVGGEACGEAPRPNRTAHLTYAIAAVEINKVNRKPHKECVDGFARNDPEPSPGLKPVAPEQTLVAFGTRIGYFELRGEHGLAGEVLYCQARLSDGLGFRAWVHRSPWNSGVQWIGRVVLQTPDKPRLTCWVRRTIHGLPAPSGVSKA